MNDEPTELPGPDLEAGVPAETIVEGEMLLGHALGERVVVARSGGRVFAVSDRCTHYGGSLAEGLLSGGVLRCPLHHARFSLSTGVAIAAPALEDLSCFVVEVRDGRVRVTGKRAESRPAPLAISRPPSAVVVVGGGGAGHAAVETLRREGYSGPVTVLAADSFPPCDRPNLSKDYLAGSAPEDWLPLRPPEFYEKNTIELVLGARVSALDVAACRVTTEDGRTFPYGALLLATGADPVTLRIPGAELPHVRYLRTVEDSRAIVARLETARRAVVIGASFIGLEAAAALRERGVEVRVVAPEARPLERILGAEIGDFVRRLHEARGVEFHLGRGAASIDAASVMLDDGTALAADLVVVGVGVRPSLTLAENAGLALDRGITVDEYLQTSQPGIFAAGDVARWPDPHTGERIRVEHWVVAERHGQIAARNMLGRKVPCTLVPFFWSQHYDTAIKYVGHAERWDGIDVEGDLDRRDARVSYRLGGKVLAVATIGRDRENLRAELELDAAQPA